MVTIVEAPIDRVKTAKVNQAVSVLNIAMKLRYKGRHFVPFCALQRNS